MTIPYNISMDGIGEHLMEHFEEKWVLKDRMHLCKIIYFVLTK